MSVKLGDNPLGRIRADKNIVRIMYRRRVRSTVVAPKPTRRKASKSARKISRQEHRPKRKVFRH